MPSVDIDAGRRSWAARRRSRRIARRCPPSINRARTHRSASACITNSPTASNGGIGRRPCARDWWRPHHARAVLRAAQTGVTSSPWLDPAHEYTRYWVASAGSTISTKTVKTFATAAAAALRQPEDG